MHEESPEGLKHDLVLMRRKMIERRQALTVIGAAAGSFALAGGIADLMRPARALAGGTCTADAAETAGPYPADGTNHAMGETSDVLTESGVVRKDIRYSFLGTTTKAKGVKVKLKLKIENSAGCAPLPGAAVYVWHCDRDALYSLYTIASESYLRGVQVADANGKLSFTTIFPACYHGRYPHIHVEVFESLQQATNGHNALLTTQLALPEDACNDVYDNAKGYEASINNFKYISLQTDGVFKDDTPEQLAAMTPRMKGSWKDGYTASATLALAV
jgi:protocatechuate 3,4-dioxygenase beta subunit